MYDTNIYVCVGVKENRNNATDMVSNIPKRQKRTRGSNTE